jgi:hypothetical protein
VRRAARTAQRIRVWARELRGARTGWSARRERVGGVKREILILVLVCELRREAVRGRGYDR